MREKIILRSRQTLSPTLSSHKLFKKNHIRILLKMGDDSGLQLVDLELEDEVIKGVKVIDPPIKGTKNLDHGLPEHQWCPKKEHIIDPDEEKTKVLQKYRRC